MAFHSLLNSSCLWGKPIILICNYYNLWLTLMPTWSPILPKTWNMQFHFLKFLQHWRFWTANVGEQDIELLCMPQATAMAVEPCVRRKQQRRLLNLRMRQTETQRSWRRCAGHLLADATSRLPIRPQCCEVNGLDFHPANRRTVSHDCNHAHEFHWPPLSGWGLLEQSMDGLFKKPPNRWTGSVVLQLSIV